MGIIKILAVGDVVGRPGRKALAAALPRLREREKIDLVIVNAENAAGGSGVTPKIAEELLSCQVDILTSGDHIWKKNEVFPYLNERKRLLRPANYPPGAPGFGSVLTETKDGRKVGVINLVGRVFMEAVECPFRTAQREIEKLRESTPIIIVDIHAEATSEKLALGYYLDGKASAVLGTHTHIPTADERILPCGTAYITDLGMTGPFDSILGRRHEQIIERFLNALPTRFDIAGGNIEIQGVVVEVEGENGRAKSIRRVREKVDV